MKSWDSHLLPITTITVILNYIAFFACLYMLGSVVDGDGKELNGIWKHFYFSAVTLTTLGYGNITPNDAYTEFVAVLESIVGFMGFAVLAGIVGSIAVNRSKQN